jgi:hypothetical protein
MLEIQSILAEEDEKQARLREADES